MNMSRRKIAIMLLTFVSPRIMSMQASSQPYADLSKNEAKTPTEEQYKAAMKARAFDLHAVVQYQQTNLKRTSRIKAPCTRTGLSRIKQPDKNN